MANIKKILPVADILPDELKELPEEKCDKILVIRRDIVRALVEKVKIWADGRVRMYGLLDESEAAQFDLGSRPS